MMLVFLSFEFIPASSPVNFRYVFASNEYPDFVCSKFNDVFAFFVSGPKPLQVVTMANQNIALIPGTNLPVAINTINPGVAGIESNGGDMYFIEL